MSSSTNGLSKLYVGDLGVNKKSDLTRLFSKYGQILTIYCDENKHFAFIEFASPVEARRALERTNNKTVNGSKLRVEFAKSDKPYRADHRQVLSRDRSPASIMYSHLQFTANRLPSMQSFRQTYHNPSMNSYSYSSSNSSRGRSLTPPSLKNNFRFSGTTNFRPTENCFQPVSNEFYSTQRFTNNNLISMSRKKQSIHSISEDFQRSRSRHQNSPSNRRRSSREKKRQRSESNSSSSSTPSSNQKQNRERGPKTPPPVKKRTSPDSNEQFSTSEQKLSTSSSSDNEKKLTNSTRNRKHSKRKRKE